MNPRFVLGISIIANVALAGLVLWLLREGLAESTHPPVAVAIQIAPARAEAVRSAAVAPNAEPFRWSQLESTDYRTYLANLRNVGCPEQTIRDILTADLDGVYAPRRAQLERGPKRGPAAPREVEAKLQELRNEEASILGSLLGDAAPVPQVAAATQPGVRVVRNAAPVMPLVLEATDPAVLQLNPEQLAAINRVRQKFQNEIGVQDPGDPAYRLRWNTAQRSADDRLRGLLGSKAYIEYQRQAAIQVAGMEKPE